MPKPVLAGDVEQLLRSAAELAVSWNHHHLGTEHLLLARLEAERDGDVAPVVTSAAGTMAGVETTVRVAVPPNEERQVAWEGVVWTPRVQRILGIAEGWALADAWPGGGAVTSETVLLAMLIDGGGVAVHALLEQGVDVDALIADIGAQLRAA